MKKKVVRFPTYNISYGDAYEIVKHRLYDDTIAYQSKVLAIEKVANMETHNGVKKDELVTALRWIFEHYDFDVR